MSSGLASATLSSDFKLHRLAMLMEPEPENPQEVEGVLNPAAVRGPDGKLYLFPRLVAKNNYSRIGIARVVFDEAGDPTGVERLGIALEPEADYECRPNGGGGCEDPRVTYVEPLHRYIMTYTAFSPDGPRIALAESEDLFHWKRLGLATYAHWHGIDKAYGIKKLRDILGVSLQEMIYIGDALFVGGNDYPAKQVGVISIPIRNPDETKRVIEAIIACLGPEQQSRSFEVDQ